MVVLSVCFYIVEVWERGKGQVFSCLCPGLSGRAGDPQAGVCRSVLYSLRLRLRFLRCTVALWCLPRLPAASFHVATFVFKQLFNVIEGCTEGSGYRNEVNE